MNNLITDLISTSDEFLNVELDWDFDAEISDCENDLDYLKLAEATSLSNLESINSNAENFPPFPIEFSGDLPFTYHKETVVPPSYCQSPSDVHSVKTVSDTSSTADQSFYSTSETSLESLDQGFYKETRPRPVQKAARKRAVTTRRWKKPKDAPKRYLSAYNIFFSEERRRVHAESDQSIGFSELGKTIGKRWSTLTDEQREPYEIMAEKDIGRYRDEIKMYEETRRRKYGRFSSSSVTTSSSISRSLSEDSRSASPGRVSPALPSRNPPQYVRRAPPPTVYAPQMIMPDQHHGQYNIDGDQWQQQQQYLQQPQPQVQYECYRMTVKEAQNYMHQCHAGGQYYAQSL